MILCTHPLVFIPRHIQDVHVTVELGPTGKVSLPILHLAYVTKAAVFAKIMPWQTVNFSLFSLINYIVSLWSLFNWWNVQYVQYILGWVNVCVSLVVYCLLLWTSLHFAFALVNRSLSSVDRFVVKLMVAQLDFTSGLCDFVYMFVVVIWVMHL